MSIVLVFFFDTDNLTKYILSGAKKFIPIREYIFPKSPQFWLTKKGIATFAEKHADEGYLSYEVKRDACARILWIKI